MRTVIVYGPPGCGKSLHAERLRAYVGCTRVVDGWAPTQPIQGGALHLTNEPVGHLAGAEVRSYSSLEGVVGKQ